MFFVRQLLIKPLLVHWMFAFQLSVCSPLAQPLTSSLGYFFLEETSERRFQKAFKQKTFKEVVSAKAFFNGVKNFGSVGDSDRWPMAHVE